MSIDSEAKDKDNSFFKSHQNLIEALPEKTKIYLLGQNKDLKKYLQEFSDRKIIPLEIAKINFWIQDSFEVLNGEEILIPAKRYPVFNPKLSFSILEKIRPKIIETPFYFEGGNMTIARLPNNQVVVFLGFGSVLKTIKNMPENLKEGKSKNELIKITKKEIENFFKKYNLKVIFLGAKIENKKIFHIDQAILFLDKDKVFLAKYGGEKFSEVKEQLNSYKKQLLNLGYQILEIPYTDNDILENKFSLNSIVFLNNKNQKEVIFPIFEGEYQKGKSGENILKGKAKIFQEELEKLNIKSRPIIDKAFHKFNGSFHCVSNVLG